MVVESEQDALHMDTSIPVVPTPAIAVAAQVPEVQEDRQDITVIPEAESDQLSLEIKTEDDTNNPPISTSSTALADEFINQVPVVTNVISDESAVSAPLNEETPLQQFEASVDSRDSDAIVIEDTKNINPSHDLAAEGNNVLELTAEEGAPTDTSVNATITASVEESIDPNFEHIASSDISKPESELPSGDGDTPLVGNPQDSISTTTVELDTEPTHVDETPLEDVKDVAAEPSAIKVDPASESSTSFSGASESETIENSYPLGSTLGAHIDAEQIGEPTEKQAIVETTAVDDLVVDQVALGKVEVQSFDQTETNILNGNGHSTTAQETIGTHGMFLNLYITFCLYSLTGLEASSGLFTFPQVRD